MSEEHSTDGDGHEADGEATGNGKGRDEFLKAAATIGVIGVGAALFEAALIPGIIIGVAAAFAPKYLPQATAKLQPAFKCAVRGAYKLSRKTKEAFSEAREQVGDIVAEVHAEGAKPAAPDTAAE